MEHLINLNFAPGGLPATVHVSQYDDTIRQLRFQLWFGRSKVEVPSGASVRVDIKKPDGHIVLVNGTVNSSDRSIVTVPTTKQMTAVPGGSRGTLVVSSTGDKRISSAIFILQVHRDPVEDGDASDSDLSMLQDAIDQTAANASAAAASAAEAQEAAESFTTDTTLSVTGKAADAKKTGDEISAIKADLDKSGLLFVDALYPQDYVVENIFINSSIKWSTNGKSIFIPVSDTINTITVKANSSNLTLVAFLTSNQYSNGSAVSTFVNGTTRTVIQAGETETFAIPSGCQYINIALSYSTNDYTPAEIKTYKSTISEINTTIVANDEKVDELFGKLITSKSIDLDEFETYNIIISSSNSKWGSTGNDRACWIIPCDADNVLKVYMTANSNAVTSYAFLTSNAHESGNTPAYCQGTGRNVLSEGESIALDVPSTCKYLYVLKFYGGSTYTPSALSFDVIGANTDADGVNAYPLGLHEMPRSLSALNIVKRCRQMTDIKWTPAVDLPRLMSVVMSNPPETAEIQFYKGSFKAGREYKGIPYGRVSNTMDAYGYDSGTVGIDIGFDTFIASVSNPNSMLSKRDVSNVSQHMSIPYATVCSGFTCYALGVHEVSTAAIPNISGLSLVGKINDNGTLLGDDEFKIGDILNLQASHTAIVTDIIRDENDQIQSIEISEATPAGLADKTYADGKTGGVARRKGWTRWHLFYERWKDYSLYRYSGTVTYTPSQYVNVGDEFDGFRVEHFPIMPYEGEGFVYKSGYIPNSAVKLIINSSDYAYVKVFKDGAEISGSPFALAEGADSINIDTITAGDYSAYLCNISNGDVVYLTYPCHWSIE